MLRFVIQCHECDFNSGLERRELTTIDIDHPEMERLLRRGGKGEMGFESWQLLGVQVIVPPDAPNGQ